ncbi:MULTISPECIES: phosphoribosylglycinamide formyltransferase [unclassified Paenibacillus]|uniref:phosphoribosylglycinamide formyltransferase n=1 Tax=unclassified Paenibacillus TaxID=185978 RepID=UPI001AE5F6BE|nr:MULTISPECIES: phosphoribosylglycinamide formyltransferase [unclassified Paenibacillus]MBP1153867.1 phosphoribosylglycinamide formyltransferase-1 [Paenibacillus sp. PvP091]MBP1170748.1 phosphoribosylglycinamide formyltransferase-1 [Paenibacillus sp. PvR098]MBP2441776.1 phosphoribosylglycinamide formyltransferase-1 [Paenibacillus sp. PvP052]
MSTAPLSIAVFASGNGSNFQAIADAVKEGRLDARIELLVCDRPKAKVVKRAEAAGIPVFAFNPKEYASREAYEHEILHQLQQRNVELIVLAGYMRIITNVLVDAYWGRMINIHPSLLPSFPGLDAVGQALRHGVKVTGVTVHLVDGGLDSGPILAQRAIDIQPGDTEASIAERIHEIEHRLYPQVIQGICNGSIRLEQAANFKPKDGITP